MEEEQSAINYKNYTGIIRIVVIISVIFSSCNILKLKPKPVENWFISFFEKDIDKNEILNIIHYDVQHQTIQIDSERELDFEEKNNLLNKLSSISYAGTIIGRRTYAYKICLQDTALFIWGNNTYVGPYDSDESYKYVHN